MPSRRRIVAAVVGLATLNATILPTLMLVQSAPARKPLPIVRQSIAILGQNGQTVRQYAGNMVFTNQARQLRSGMLGGSKSLDSVATQLREYQRKLPSHATNVAMTLQVIDALKATSDADFHMRVQALPVTIVKTTVADSLGRPGVKREFIVRGKVKAMAFEAFNTASPLTIPVSSRLQLAAVQNFEPVSLSSTHDASGPLGDGFDGFAATNAAETIGPSVPESSPVAKDCSYTDDESNNWTGQCATTQEIDDAIAALAALQSDAESIQTTSTAESTDYCDWHHDTDEEYCGAATRPSPELSVGMDALQVSHAGPSVPKTCYQNGIGYGVAVAFFGYRMWKITQVVGIAAPPVAAVGEALFLGVMAGAVLAGAAIGLHDCICAH